MIVWITGASSGIGEACAYQYAMLHHSLILTSSSVEKLASVDAKCKEFGAQTFVLPYDLENADGIEDLVQTAWQHFGHIDILFCNAGISQRTDVENTSMKMTRKIMEINYFAPVAMAKAILPLMLSDGGGQIAVTTSIAGRFGFPLRCAYSSSKHALYGFFETLQAEYAHKGIKVTLVCPGRIKTNISCYALDKGGQRHGQMDPGQLGGMSADDAARKIVRAISKGKREVLVGKKELIMVYIKRFSPWLCAKLSQNIKPV